MNWEDEGRKRYIAKKKKQHGISEDTPDVMTKAPTKAEINLKKAKAQLPANLRGRVKDRHEVENQISEEMGEENVNSFPKNFRETKKKGISWGSGYQRTK